MDMQIISVASIIGMIFSLAIAIGVPVALLVLIVTGVYQVQKKME